MLPIRDTLNHPYPHHSPLSICPTIFPPKSNPNDSTHNTRGARVSNETRRLIAPHYPNHPYVILLSHRLPVLLLLLFRPPIQEAVIEFNSGIHEETNWGGRSREEGKDIQHPLSTHVHILRVNNYDLLPCD